MTRAEALVAIHRLAAGLGPTLAGVERLAERVSTHPDAEALPDHEANMLSVTTTPAPTLAPPAPCSCEPPAGPSEGTESSRLRDATLNANRKRSGRPGATPRAGLGPVRRTRRQADPRTSIAQTVRLPWGHGHDPLTPDA